MPIETTTEYRVDVEKLLDLAEQTQAALAEVDPIYAHANRFTPTDKPHALILTSDLHLFSRWLEYREFRDVLQWIRETPNLSVVLLGDETDGFTQFFHSRPQMDQLIKPPVQRRVLFEILESLRPKLLCHCMGTGGHGTERWLGEDLVRQWFVQHDIPSFVGQGILDWQVGAETYTLLLSHDFPGSSKYNAVHAQGVALKEVDPTADIVASGHRHRSAISRVNHHEMAYRAGHLPINSSWLVAVGTAKCLDDPFALTKWQQGSFEWFTFAMWPYEHRVEYVQRRDDLAYYLGK